MRMRTLFKNSYPHTLFVCIYPHAPYENSLCAQDPRTPVKGFTSQTRYTYPDTRCSQDPLSPYPDTLCTQDPHFVIHCPLGRQFPASCFPRKRSKETQNSCGAKRCIRFTSMKRSAVRITALRGDVSFEPRQMKQCMRRGS